MGLMRRLLFGVIIAAVALGAGGVEVIAHEDGPSDHAVHAPGAYRSVLMTVLDGGHEQPPIGFGHDEHHSHSWAMPLLLVVTMAVALGPLSALAGRAALLRPVVSSQLLASPAVLPPR